MDLRNTSTTSTTKPTILTVCTGNICRSPAAELLLARALGSRVAVHSAGTSGLNGVGIPEEMLAELEADGIDGRSHQGRRMTAAMARDADLIVAMTRAHRQAVVQLEPRALRRSFTLAELAAAARTGATLTGSSLEERLAQVPAEIAAHRPVLADLELTDVPDPYRRPRAEYHRAYELIRDAVSEIGQWLTLPDNPEKRH